MEELIKDLVKVLEEPSDVTKTLMNLGYNEGYNPYVVDAIYEILLFFQHCIENIEEYENFEHKDIKNKKEILYSMLEMMPSDITFEELLKWVTANNYKDYLDIVVKDCITKREKLGFEEILRKAYHSFLQSVGAGVIEALTEEIK